MYMLSSELFVWPMSNRNSKWKELSASGKSEYEKYLLHNKSYSQLFGKGHDFQALNPSLFLQSGQVLISAKVVFNSGSLQFRTNSFWFKPFCTPRYLLNQVVALSQIYFYLKFVLCSAIFLTWPCLFISSFTRCKRKKCAVFSIPQVCCSARFSIRHLWSL